MYKELGISEKIEKLSNEAEEEIKEQFKKIEEINTYNSLKVLKAFKDNNISEMHFNSTTGYGYGDIGRDTIEKVYAQIFKTEDALVRNQFISGTHALTVALFGMLRPKDKMLSITGMPYDTLCTVIGIEENKSSLKSFGIDFEQIDLKNNDFDEEKIIERVSKNDIKLIEIQRSRGYSTRDSLSIDKIEKIIKEIRKVNKEVIIMVDNCYGEFVDTKEPTEVGADIMVGSLIKNLGGGIASNGAYIAGRADLIELCAEKLTKQKKKKEVGPSLGANRSFLQGLYLAPNVVASALKTAVFTARMMEKLGYRPSPRYDEKRNDIVQTIEFGNPNDLIKYCQGIQMGSAVDANSIPEPWDMPGYSDKVIMAAGAFTMGSSIELSCDAPIREPFIAYQQGALTYEYGKLGVLIAIQNMMNTEK